MIRYCVVVGRNDERTEGPPDAEVVVTVGIEHALDDPTVAYMQGKLKSTGPTGPLLEALRSGAAAGVLRRLAGG